MQGPPHGGRDTQGAGKRMAAHTPHSRPKKKKCLLTKASGMFAKIFQISFENFVVDLNFLYMAMCWRRRHASPGHPSLLSSMPPPSARSTT